MNEALKHRNYEITLGANYDPTPYRVIFTDLTVAITGVEGVGHYSHKEALEFAEEKDLPEYGWVIYNTNADWK